ncbi:MAG: site-specific integrase [Bacteroidia bacterium]|jgi:site-specific recombinase XerD|nr:site-specific integrase [Bacteroidia bacterium]
MFAKIREKKLKDGRISLRLDIYCNGVRKVTTLELYLSGKRGDPADKAIRMEAELRRRKAYDEMTLSGENPVVQAQKSAVCFFVFMERSIARRKTLNKIKSIYKQLKEFTGTETLPISKIDKDFLLDFQKYLFEDMGNVSNSVHGKMSLFSTLMNEAKAEGLIKVNPFSDIPRHLRVKSKLPKINPLNAEDIRALMANTDGIPRQVQQVFFVSLFTGLRWSDVSRIEKAKIKTALIGGERRKVYTFIQRKVDQSAQQPLSKEAIHYIAQRLMDERKEMREAQERGAKFSPSPYLFPKMASPGHFYSGYGYMHPYLIQWGIQAGLNKRFHFHLARHSFATLMLELTGNLQVVKELLGHANVSITQRYAHVLDAHKTAAIDKLASLRLVG